MVYSQGISVGKIRELYGPYTRCCRADRYFLLHLRRPIWVSVHSTVLRTFPVKGLDSLLAHSCDQDGLIAPLSLPTYLVNVLALPNLSFGTQKPITLLKPLTRSFQMASTGSRG